MADYEARVGIDFDVTQATAALQRLQQQISAFQSALTKGSAASAKAASNLQRDLVNNINATGKFSASMTTVASSAENFTRALEANKLSMGQYFRYAGASTKTFGRFFKGEFDTINKVVRERVKTIQTQFIKMGRDSNGALQAIKVRPLALDLKDYGTQAQMAAQRQAIFNQLVKQGSTQLLNFGKNTQWAGRQLMVGFTIPLAIMGSTAVREFEKIEKQAIRFKRVYGDAFSTTSETDQALKNVRALANEFTKYGVEVEKTLELAADAAQMGLKNADLLAQVTEATRLAVLGEVEQQEALEASISLTNAFGIAAEDLAQKINFLNAVENETVTAISDLTIAIPKAGPVIQQLGGSVEDLAFFLTAMKEGGINASEGANALKSGLAKIINPTEKASLMLQGLGINLTSIVESNAGNIKNTVLELADALDSLDPLNRARAIEELFGRFQFARISTLFQNIVREGSQAERVLKLTRASAEELAILSERELKRVEESPLFRFQKTVERLQAALAPLGEEFLKAITPIVEFATKFLENFNNMSDGAKRFAVVATTVIAGIGPVALMTFGLIANGVANLIKLFSNVGRLFGKFGSQTNNLGLQTNYLTQEQLESQAAAISMGQAHANLTQVITSQTAAVSALAAAYNTMTAAQRRAAANQGIALPNAPAGPKPKKYNKGIFSVPGPKGAGDVVPAMLSPGEAVIPAKQSRKYSGLIQGMIADNIPGYRFGLNPFAAMLRNSRVTTRMKSETLRGMLGKKDFRYKSAFETGTGDDYLDRITGRPKLKQQSLRTEMEDLGMGIPRKAPASSRPTYGSVELTPMGRLISRIFGLSGKQFRNIAKPGNQYLDIYGDTELVGKRSLNRRSSFFAGDLLRSFDTSRMSWVYKRQQSGSTGSLLPPMRGASKEQLEKQFWTFRHPFGKSIPGEKSPGGGQSFTANPGYPYIESQVAGGFNLNEISKIRVPSRAEARQLQKLVDQAGLKIRVTPRNASSVVKLFANMFGTRFSKGTARANRYDNSTQSGLFQDLKRRLRGAPSAISDATKGLGYASFAQEEAILRKVLEQELRKQYPTISKVALEKKIASFMGMDRAHIRKSERMETFGGKQFAVKNWDIRNIQMDHRSVNQFLQNATDRRGFLAGLNASSIARQAGVSQATAARELASLRAGNHVSPTQNGYKILRAITAEYGGARATALGKMLDFRINDRSKGSYFKSLAAGKLHFAGDADAVNEKALKQQQGRIATAQRKLEALKPKDSAIVKPTTGTKKPSSVKRVGGTAKDTRMIAVSPNEAVLTEKTVNSLNNGKTVGVRGLGNLFAQRAGRGFSILGKAKDPNQVPMPSQSQQSTERSGRILGKGFLKEAFKPAALKETFVKAGKAAGTAIARPLAIRLGNIAGNDIVDKNGKVINTGNNATKGFLGVKPLNAPAPGTITQTGNRYYQIDENGKKRPISKEKAMLAQKGNQKDGTPKRGIGMAGIGGTVMTAGMMASFSGDPKMADIGSKAMIGGMALSMLPMLANPYVAALAAVVAFGGGVMYLQSQLNKARESGIKTAEAMAMTADKLEAISEFTGEVSATEIRQKRQESLLAPQGEGNRQFGQVFLDSDIGKSLVDDIKTQLANNIGRGQTATNIGEQLAMAIAQGVLTAEQGRSIAAALGQQMNDYGFALRVSARITSLVGPNGEKLEKEPLKVAIQLQAAGQQQAMGTMQRAASAQETSSPYLDPASLGIAPGFKIGAGITSLVVGAGVAKAALAAGAVAATNFWNPVGWAAIAASVGLIGYGLWEANQAMQKTEKLNALAIAQAGEQLALGQQNIDWINESYATKIADKDASIDALKVTAEAATTEEARAEALEKIKTLETEIGELKSKQRSDIEAIAKQSVADFYQLSEGLSRIEEGGGNISAILDKAVESRFEGNELAIESAKQALDTIEKFQRTTETTTFDPKTGARQTTATALDLTTADKSFQSALRLGIVSGDLSASSAEKLINLATSPDSSMPSLYISLISERGMADASTIVTLLENAGVNDSVFESLFGQISRSGESYQDVLQALSILSNIEGRYGVSVNLNSDGEEALTELSETIQALEDMPDTMTKEAFADFKKVDPELYDALIADWDRIVGTDNEITKQIILDAQALGDWDAVQQYLIFTEQMDKAIDKALGGQRVVADRVMDPGGLADKLKEEYEDEAAVYFLPDAEVRDSGDKTETKTELGQRSTLLDSILNRLKQIRDATINATGGLKELKRILDDDKDLTKFVGFNQQLLFKGYGSEFINFLNTLEKADRKKFLTITTDGLIKVTAAGKALNKAFAEATLGDFQFGLVQGIADANKQAAALNILMGNSSKIKLERVLSEADAMAIASDATLAYAIATAKSSEEIQKIIDDFNKLEAAQRNLNFQTKEGTAEEFGKLYDKAVGYLEAQQETINSQFEIATNLDRDIIRAAQDDINAINYELDDYQAELTEISELEKDVNKKYDDRLDALDKIMSINADIARQERASLDIANALAQGDIASAARAMREKQAEDARAAADKQKEQIEKAREVELSRLISANGRTREQIDEKILELQKQIFTIEEERLEPAQERVRLLDVERQKALDSLQDQIDQWALLSAQVNEAKLKLTPEEMSAMEYQAGLIRDMLKNWDSIEDKEAILKIIKKTYGDSEASSPSASSAPASGGSGSSPSTGTVSSTASSNVGSAITGTALNTPEKLDKAITASKARVESIDSKISSAAKQISVLKNVPGMSAVVDAMVKQKAADAYTKSWELKAQAAMKKKSDSLKISAAATAPKYLASGGMTVGYYPMGGLIPYMASGGMFKAINTDTVPAMLTPGEFVMRRNSVKKYGTDMMKSINSGTYSGDSVYNYSVNVNVKSDSNPEQIARAVMTQIKQVDSQRIRSNRY